MKELNLDPDVQRGIVPISHAASHLAALLVQAAQTQRPIAVTQKGYPTAVLLDIETWERLKAAIEQTEGAPRSL